MIPLLLLVACGGDPAPPPAEPKAETRAPAAPAPEPTRYENERFRFAIDVPAGFEARDPPQNADGRAFADPRTGAELVVFGAHNAPNLGFEAQVDAVRQDFPRVRGETIGSHAWRGTATGEQGRRTHILLVRPTEERLIAIRFSYPDEHAERMRPLAEATRDSLRVVQRIGPVSLRYDPLALAPTESEIGIPPASDREVRGLKLVARERAALLGTAECLYGLSGEATRCTAGKEAGLAFALLDRPYAELASRLTDPPPRPIALAQREGVGWEIGAEGEGADHMLVPLDGRTLLIVRHYRRSGNPDPGAIQQVLESLAIDGD